MSEFTRKKAIHGGSLIFVHNNIKSKNREDITSLSVERITELSCVELEQYIIVCVYRPPMSDFTTFEVILETALKRICVSRKHVVVCGDFNVNLLEESPTCIRLISLFKSFDLHHLFMEPTRITSHSATCLDNVFCNCQHLDKFILNELRSDHCGQKVTFPTSTIVKENKFTYTPITEEFINKFKAGVVAELANIDMSRRDPDVLYNSLFNVVSLEYKNTFKAKTIKKKEKVSFCDWATPGIYISRHKMFELYGMKQYNFDPAFVNYVRKYSRIFKKICAEAKSLFLSKKIQHADNKIKATWKVINNETGRTKPRDNHIELNVDNRLITSSLELAETFNDFFVNIPINTTSSLCSSSVTAETVLRGNVRECDILFSFHYIRPNDIIKTFKSLNSKKTTDLWGISVKIIENIVVEISPYLAAIFNECVDTGIFPNLMKHSKILPLFKNGSKTDPTNFRPISILPAFSKIFEKVILQQLESHFNINKLLHNEQYGFRKNRSTIDAGAALMQHIFSAWENSQDAVGVFCDLSKAFDCVEHLTLLKKLRHYGVKDAALDLVASYLCDRIQRVDINGTTSSGSPVTMGVPQGSILGPFLFLVYINDLPFYVQNFCDIVLFADDTSLIFKVDRRDSVLDKVNSSLARVQDWFTANNLLLNSKKTKCLRFTLPNVKKLSSNIALNDETIDLVESTVFLGITLDRKLQWGAHIECLAGKLSSAAFAVWKVRQLTDVNTARLVYFSYFHSVMSYGILLWGKAADIESIFIIQKRAVRAIYNLGARVSLKDRFKEVDILTVASQYIYENIMFVRKNIDKYTKNADVHTYNTRNSHKLAGSHHRLHKVHNSFAGLSVRFYNKLPLEVMNLPSHKFKITVKNHLMERGYYTLNDFLNDRTPWKKNN